MSYVATLAAFVTVVLIAGFALMLIKEVVGGLFKSN